jgi:hypothetical protein
MQDVGRNLYDKGSQFIDPSPSFSVSVRHNRTTATARCLHPSACRLAEISPTANRSSGRHNSPPAPFPP